MSIAPLTAALSNVTQNVGSPSAIDSSTSGASGASFGDMLGGALSNVNTLQNDAAQQATSFALGKATDIHDVMISAQKASVALNLTAALRNKVIDAYQSVMSMQM